MQNFTVDTLKETISSDDLNNYTYIKEYNPYEIVFNENENCNKIGIIIDGKINAIITTNSGKDESISLFTKDMMFGQYLIFSEKNEYIATGICIQKTKILFISKKNLLLLLQKYNSLLQLFLNTLCEEAFETRLQNKLLVHKNIRDRILFYLTTNQKDNVVKIKNISDLARILSLPRPSVSRELSKMEKENIIQRKDKYIILCK